MPFTFAHPAIIIPLNKSKRFSFTALIAGSMVPDFEFFLQLREVENIGHHWLGFFLFDYPLSLIMCFLFHNVLRNPMVDNLPSYLRIRIIDVRDFNWNNYAKRNKLKITFSLFIGIASHLLWDGFTHSDGLFIEMLPVLSENVEILVYSIPVYFLLQLVFSIAGLIAVIYSTHRMPVQKLKVEKERNKTYWPMFLIVMTIILFIRLAGWPEYNSFWGVFMAVMGGICYSWILISLLYKNYLLKKRFL